MKRILIANKFYYNRGGDCVISIALEKLLKEKGHKVAFFSMQHPNNFDCPWNEYFPSYIDFQSHKIINIAKSINRLYHDHEVKKKFKKLIHAFKPDIVHLNNIHSQLSPIIGEIAHKENIKVIWTLHDYKLICPSYSCLRNGKPCELCVSNGINNVLYKKCMKNSLPASALAYIESCYWHRARLNNNTDLFIAPSTFMKNMMIKGGFPATKIRVLSNFTNRDLPTSTIGKENFYCYVGRLSTEKGVKTLIKVAKQLPYHLKIIGDGPLKDELLDEKSDNIEFVGFKEWNEFRQIVGQAKFVIMPSECYENNPLSVIEALSLGTPVLGANIGGIPELINEQNGMLFEAGNADDMREKIEHMFDKVFNYTDICTAAREKYSAESYYRKLIEIYEQ